MARRGSSPKRLRLFPTPCGAADKGDILSRERISPLDPQENARGSAPRPRHCERAARRAAVLAESDACLVLYLNDLTLFYLRCRFACVSTVFSNLRLLRIFIVLLLSAKAALLRSPRRGASFLVLCCDIDFFCFLLGRDKCFFGVAVILCFDLGKCVGDRVE